MERGSEPSNQLHDFAVKDTSAITKIFLADKFGATVTLEREDVGEWTVNEDYKAEKMPLMFC